MFDAYIALLMSVNPGCFSFYASIMFWMVSEMFFLTLRVSGGMYTFKSKVLVSPVCTICGKTYPWACLGVSMVSIVESGRMSLCIKVIKPALGLPYVGPVRSCRHPTRYVPMSYI